ncbi:MAG TPA: L-erythro-3,5-diaminohexanoate dehydrogenase [Anaerolineaceae bacterium]|nr:L-erythro-3,5-diaminohexanoate dehydrogenase [Chloroflexota bacterium]HPL81215.1 L-erythro-3,5-diaminohexanoate dehydrogenase [Anaerolineaceae bacterium]
MAKGNKYGAHRVIEPKGLLPQAAHKIDNSPEIYDNEILIEVSALNIDSASFTQLWTASEQDKDTVKQMIMDIVNERGKMQNPVTGSGGVLMGSIAAIGPDLKDRDLKVGDRIVTLVSLSLTPLKLEEIYEIHPDIDRVDVKGTAILFESGIYAKLPDDMSEALAMAALDVAGAPAQTANIVKPGDSVLILGAGGKSGMLCGYEAMKRVGPAGNVVGMSRNNKYEELLLSNKLVHKYFVADAASPVDVLEKALEANDGKEYDVAINVVNIPGTEMSTILPVRNGGLVYFFSMATSFTRAALGAEGVGKDVSMIIGNGYTKDHDLVTLEILRESPELRKIFEQNYL